MADKEYSYILENPIKVDIGYLYPIKVKDYETFQRIGGIAQLDKVALINNFKDIVKKDERFQPFLEVVEELDMYDFIRFCGLEQYKDSFLYDLNKQYVDLFKFCTKNNNGMVFEIIETDENFQHYIKIIRKMNGIPYEATSPNPEVERRNELTRKLESMKGENIDFESMFTSVCVGLQKTPIELGEMTLYSFYKIFNRIAHFKGYDRNILFATVTDNVTIEPWYKVDEIIEKNQQYITEEQINKAREQGELRSNL